MATRPYWSGQIRLSLVSVPVNIYAAVNSARTIPLHEIYRKTGERVHHQLLASNKVIDREDVIKGYEYKKGRYVLLEPGEIQKLKLPSKNTLEIVQFVPTNEIDAFYFERPYFVVPKDHNAEDAFATIREGLRKTGTYGLGQLVIGGRERLCALKPCGRGMMLDTIRYRDEVRKADEYFEDIEAVKVGKDELRLIEQLIKQKTAEFKPDKFHDHYREALRELIEAKQENRAPEYEEETPRSKVVNLMDALKKSLRGDAASSSSKAQKVTKKSSKARVVSIPKPKAKPTKTPRKAS
jgi:DNA end-binding protein Ku